MKKVLEMREKRAKAWDAAKAFLDARAKDGVLSAEDNATYDKMVADVDAMARQIAIEEDRVARDAAMAEPTSKPLTGKWQFSFMESARQVKGCITLDSLTTWEHLPLDSASVTMGTGVYTTTVRLTKQEAAQSWAIDLGDVRESARVYINDRYIGCAWAVPFVLRCGNALHAGVNQVRIEVTNLPANRISYLDRNHVKWRKFNEINVVDLNYKKSTYETWSPVKSGLNSTVKLSKIR